MKKIKVSRLDAAFSQLVRERAAWCCEKCGQHYTQDRRRGLECSHLFGRRHYSVRWHPLNAAAHCTGCHFDLGSNPIEFAEWIKDHLGSQYQELIDLKNTPIRFREADKKEMLAHFNAELERLQSLRDRGKTGRLEFSAWEMP